MYRCYQHGTLVASAESHDVHIHIIVLHLIGSKNMSMLDLEDGDCKGTNTSVHV